MPEKHHGPEPAHIERRRRRALISSFAAVALLLAAAVAIVLAFLKSADAKHAEEKAQAAMAEAQRQTAIAQLKIDTAMGMREKAMLADSHATLTKQEARQAVRQAVAALLEQAREDVRRLRYDRAFSKMKSAAALGVLQDSVAFELMEIAYFHHHSGHDDRATGPFYLAARLLGKPGGTGKMAFEQLDAGRARWLKKRYFEDMVDLEGGAFQMQGEYPASVAGFKMSKYETTVWQYYLFCVAKGRGVSQRIGADGRTLQVDKFQPSWGWTGDCPVVYINLYTAVEYANWLSEHLHLRPAYKIYPMQKDPLNKNEQDGFHWTVEALENTNGFRLPTELEWEYAARGGIRRDTFAYSGSGDVDAVAWHNGNSEGHTHPVGGKKANGAGIYDMSGNVYEWCFDWYDGLSVEALGGAKGGDGRVARGGAWYYIPDQCRLTFRSNRTPSVVSSFLGFRLVRI